MYNNLGLKVTFFLISLQIIHLFWLTTNVVLPFAGFDTAFDIPNWLLPLFVVIDYIEIPALITGSIFYISLLATEGYTNRNLLLLSLLCIQFIHIAWITDEVVYNILINKSLWIWPIWLAWIAILIDYLELPVIYDLFRRLTPEKPSE